MTIAELILMALALWAPVRDPSLAFKSNVVVTDDYCIAGALACTTGVNPETGACDIFVTNRLATWGEDYQAMVMAHEIGHCFGIGHPSEDYGDTCFSIMNGTFGVYAPTDCDFYYYRRATFKHRAFVGGLAQ